MKVLRSLLISALLAGTTTAFAPSFSTASRRASSLSMSVETVDTKDIIKVGVIGMGRIGLVHLEAITKAPGVTPIIVSNPTISKAEAGTYCILVPLGARRVIFNMPVSVNLNPSLCVCV